MQQRPEPDQDDHIEFPSRNKANQNRRQQPARTIEWGNNNADDGEDEIMFPSRMKNSNNAGGAWGSTSQKNLGVNKNNFHTDMDEDEIPFPSRATKKQGSGFNRPATSHMTRQEDDMWGQTNNTVSSISLCNFVLAQSLFEIL